MRWGTEPENYLMMNSSGPKMPPVIFLSAKNTVDAMVTASELGAAKYLTKPTTPEKLLDAVRNVLNRAR